MQTPKKTKASVQISLAEVPRILGVQRNALAACVLRKLISIHISPKSLNTQNTIEQESPTFLTFNF